MKYALPLLSLLFLPVTAAAVDFGTVTVEVNSARDTGTWQLLYPGGVLNHDGININTRKQTVRPSVGQVTLTVSPPAGATTRIRLYKDDVLVSIEEVKQRSIDLMNGDDYRFRVEYIFNKNGTLGITASERGVAYRMVGPDGRVYRGRAPKSFASLPAGPYSIYPQKAGCVRPRPLNRSVKQGERTVVHIEIDCTGDSTAKANSEDNRPVPSRRSLINAVKAREQARANSHRSR